MSNYSKEDKIRYEYSLDNDTIKISTNIDGLLEAVECTEIIKKNKNKLYTGITMVKLIRLTDKQWIIFDTLIFYIETVKWRLHSFTI